MPIETVLMRFADKQAEKWKKIADPACARGFGTYPVITVSMAPGSGGSVVAQKVADLLGFDFFDRELLEVVAKSAEVTPQVLEKLEQERFSGIQDFIASLLDEKYLWPGVYLEHLKNMVNAIGGRGHSVIVGRGGNFILPIGNRLGARVVAPMEERIKNVMRDFKVTEDEANKRILQRESRRSAFIKKSFHADINNPVHYDIVVNMEDLTTEAAAEIICNAWADKFFGNR